MKRTDNVATLSANVSIKIGGEPFDLKIEAPIAPTRPTRMLPVFQRACGDIVDWTVKRIEREGRSISCRAGCGACCRQMVPISKTEARYLAQLVAEMPDERREVIKERFDLAIKRLEEAGVIDKLRAEPKPLGQEYKDLGLTYFHLEVACPFLEEESCSIHPDRPLVCREYLVVSLAENCSRKNGLPIEALSMPLEASKALTAINDAENKNFTNWIPLVLSLEWAEQNPDVSENRAGTTIIEKFISKLTGSDVVHP